MSAVWHLILNITLTIAISDWYSVKVIRLIKSVFLIKLTPCSNITQEGVSICPHHVTCIFLGVVASPLFKVRIRIFVIETIVETNISSLQVI
jgi:hypothetical protein